MSKKFVIVNALLILSILCSVSFGVENRYWTDGAAGNHLWRDGANWDAGTPPTTADHRARIYQVPVGGQGPLVDSLTNVGCAHLMVGGTDSATHTLNVEMIMTGGYIDIDTWGRIGYGDGITGTLTMSDGQIDTDPFSFFSVGVYGTGYLNMSGGTLNTGQFRLAWYPGGEGHVSLGGEINVGLPDFSIRSGGSDFDILPGGILNVADPNGSMRDTIQGYIDDGRVFSSAPGYAPEVTWNGSDTATLVALVPEPMTIILLGAGGITLIRRKRR
jgi:hypothetical protein